MVQRQFKLLFFFPPDYLSIKDLSKVFREVYGACNKWHNIGIELKIGANYLAAIRTKYRDDPDDCFSELLYTWLKRVDPKPTWDSLARALRSPTVNFGYLSEKVDKIAKHHTNIPTHWLKFSCNVHSLANRIISYDECFKVAEQCGIDSREELYEALQILRTKLGVQIRYFCDGVSKIVIIDPQILFEKIMELILKSFIFEKGMHFCKELMKKGIFSCDHFKRINMSQDPLLTHSRLIELLKHLHYIYPFPDGKNFLIPSIWTHSDKALYPPRQHKEVPTLAITFHCGYCPEGVAGSVIRYLMTNEMKSKITWELRTDQVFSDQVTFCVDSSLVTLCFYPTHFEVVYAPWTERTQEGNMQATCQNVCQTIQKAIQMVSKVVLPCELSFYCTSCKSHVAEVVQYKGIPCQLWCDETKDFCDLPCGFTYWVYTHQKYPKQADPLYTTLTFPSAYKLILSLAKDWKHLGVLLLGDDTEQMLNEIEHKHENDSECLRAMLLTWLKDVACPSWQMLADAIDNFDQSIAQKIRNTYL